MSEPETFESLRPLMFAIAYRMLSSVSDAEDVVQEAYVRYRRALDDGVAIESLKAYLSAVVTRLSIDQLRSARARRESYDGLWLPEPVLTDDADMAADVADAESLSIAFLLLLERLSPIERAAFLLHDVFDYGYDDVAMIVGKTETNCRQIVARARRRIRTDRPRFDATPHDGDRLASRFFAAAVDGDLDGLVQLLADDVVVYGDGGGKAPQWRTPITGVNHVARLFVGLGRQIRELGLRVEPRNVNGQPGAVVRDADGRLINVIALDVDRGGIRAIRSVINPDKLRHLGPLADAYALRRRRRGPSRTP